MYGDPLEHPQRETYWGNVNPIGPRAVYDEAKRFAEAITMAYRRYEKVDTRIARIFNTYGPRMRLDDGRVVPTFVAQALRGHAMTVFGDGGQTRSFCYVDDLVECVWRLLHSSYPEPVNVGTPHEMTVLEFAEWVKSQRRVKMDLMAQRIGKTRYETEKLLGKALNEGLVKGAIDRTTDEFVLEEAGREEHFVGQCSHCGGNVDTWYFPEERVTCPYCQRAVTVVSG